MPGASISSPLGHPGPRAQRRRGPAAVLGCLRVGWLPGCRVCTALKHVQKPTPATSAAPLKLGSQAGIHFAVPAEIDDYVFEPCGYSMNGVERGTFSTIHITPEDGEQSCSWLNATAEVGRGWTGKRRLVHHPHHALWRLLTRLASRTQACSPPPLTPPPSPSPCPPSRLLLRLV